MNSSTSSSNARLIKRAAAVLAVMFAAYALIIPYLFPDGGVSVSQWQMNVRMAQDFIYSKKTFPVVMVGSSQSARLASDLLPVEFYNLSMNAGGALTGLEIVERQSGGVRVVLIETNLIMREPDGPFIDSLFSPVMYKLRRLIPAFREKYNPYGMFMRLLKNPLAALHRSQQEAERRRAAGMEGERPAALVQEALSRALELKKKEMSFPPNPKVLEERISILKKAVERLKEKGVKVIFYEMPVHPELAQSASSSAIRIKMLEVFPPLEFSWVRLPDYSRYRYPDGIHLDYADVPAYVSFLEYSLVRDIGVDKLLHGAR